MDPQNQDCLCGNIRIWRVTTGETLLIVNRFYNSLWMHKKHKHKADDGTKLIRKDSARAQMATHMKEPHMTCCYTSGHIYPLVGRVEDTEKDKRRRLRTKKK